jgi:hypothetical protein
MKRSAVLFGAVVLLFTCIVLLRAPKVQAQQNCLDFTAIVQAALPSSMPISPATDVWGGPLLGMLGGQVFQGVLSGNDGTDTWRKHMGSGQDGLYTICEINPQNNNYSNCFSYAVPHAVFPGPPGQKGIEFYMGNTAKIVGGKGKFVGVTGNISVSGPALAWTPNGNDYYGFWNPEIKGKVCGIQ